MIRVKKGLKSWYALAVVFLSLGLSVPAGAISADHSHGGNDSGNAEALVGSCLALSTRFDNRITVRVHRVRDKNIRSLR